MGVDWTGGFGSGSFSQFLQFVEASPELQVAYDLGTHPPDGDRFDWSCTDWNEADTHTFAQVIWGNLDLTIVDAWEHTAQLRDNRVAQAILRCSEDVQGFYVHL